MSDQEDKNDATSNENDFEEEIEDYTDEDDEDKLSRLETIVARGRPKSLEDDQTTYVDVDTATGSVDDTLVSVERLRTSTKTARCDHPRQKPAFRLKYV